LKILLKSSEESNKHHKENNKRPEFLEAENNHLDEEAKSRVNSDIEYNFGKY
jgi:hypothetical protein